MFIFYFHLKHQDKPDNDCAYDKKQDTNTVLEFNRNEAEKKNEIAKIASSLLKIERGTDHNLTSTPRNK